MTDLEMTRLCAEAMGLEPFSSTDGFGVASLWIATSGVNEVTAGQWRYDPLHDDAQAMALVKEHKLTVTYQDNGWLVYGWEWRETGTDQAWHSMHTNLNRAIVECVAKMQAAKK